MKWHEGIDPSSDPSWPSKEFEVWGKELATWGGMVMIGSKNSLYTSGRPNNPELLVSEKDWMEFQENMPEQSIPRLKWGDETPVQEWIDAIKNDYLPESNFNYAADLTEMALIGTLSQRFDAKILYDSKNMKITNNPEVDAYIKGYMREGWEYGNSIL